MTKSTQSSRRRLSHLLIRNRNKRRLADTLKRILSIVVHLRGSQDEYTCPNNKTLTKTASPSLSKDKLGFIYSTSATDCKACPVRSECLAKQTPHRRIWRWEHEAFMQSWRELMQTESAKAISKRRGAIVAHPFGTIKRSLGRDHYLVRGKEKVSGAYGFDWALIMFCYNFKRVLNMLGTMLFNKLLLAIKAGNIEAVMEEIKRHLCFCVHYSIIYARNTYCRSKQTYFTRLLLIRTFFTRTGLKMLNSGLVSRRLLHSLESRNPVNHTNPQGFSTWRPGVSTVSVVAF